MNNMNSSVETILLYTILAGIISAPKPGDETRDILSHNINDWKEKANDLVDSAKDRLIDAVEEGVEASKRSKYDLYDD